VSRIKILRYLLLYVILIGWEEGIYVLIWVVKIFSSTDYYTQGRRNWGGGGRSALWVVKYYLINHISSDAFWAKSWGVILNVTWLSAFAFIGKSTHYCRFISSPGSIEVPLWCAFAPLCLFIVPASLTVYTSVDHYNSSKCSNKSNSRSQHHSLARRYGCF
jgi:hypothetical protein